MPKRRSTLPIAIAPPAAGVPLYRWLCDELRTAAADGRLREGTRLPASRELAAELQISRGTVSLAFDWLRAEGYIESRVGAGTFVKQAPDLLLHARGGDVSPMPAIAARRPLAQWAQAVRPFLGNMGPARAFRAHQAALDLFPGELGAASPPAACAAARPISSPTAMPPAIARCARPSPTTSTPCAARAAPPTR
jgi:GntR family transcriptional regulator/MocR family aminotransferase